MHLLALAAGSEQALSRLAVCYASFLERAPGITLADLCHTANTGRSHEGLRMAVCAISLDELRDRLRDARSGKGVWAGSDSQAPKVAFLFTGQGSQFAGMGGELYETQPTFREALRRCDELLHGQLDPPLLEVLYGRGGGDDGRLDQTAYTQPALFAFEYALCCLWRRWGVAPDAVLGHSIGEYVAACVAGVLSLPDAVKLIAARGRLMQALPSDGAMAAIFAGEGEVAEAIRPFPEALSVAAVNAPRLTVISGRSDAVARVIGELAAKGVRSTRLAVSHAFHSPLVEPALEAFRKVAEEIRFAPPRLTLISNLTGDVASGEIASADYWVRHARGAVRYAAGLASLYRQGYRLFLEIGPQPTLIGMGKNCLPEGCLWLTSLRRGRSDWEPLLGSLGALYARGAKIDWQGFDDDCDYRKVPLPDALWEK